MYFVRTKAAKETRKKLKTIHPKNSDTKKAEVTE